MRKLLFLAFFLLLGFLTKAQSVSTGPLNDKILLIGIDSLSPAVRDGLFKAHFERTGNQVAFIAGRPFMSTDYIIYNSAGLVVKSGRFVKDRSGEYQLLDIGRASDCYRIVFCPAPAYVKSHKK